VQEHTILTWQDNLNRVNSCFDFLNYDSPNTAEEEIASVVDDAIKTISDIVSPAFLAFESIAKEIVALIAEVKQKIVKTLTLLEDFKYRKGLEKSALRSALFVLGIEVGSMPVISELAEGTFAILDYRKKEASSEKQKGEMYEFLTAFSQFQNEQNKENALELLIELADVIYNTEQAIGAPQLIQLFEEKFEDERTRNFLLYLSQMANYKLNHRYLIHKDKNEPLEKRYVTDETEMEALRIVQENIDMIPGLAQYLREINTDIVRDNIKKEIQNKTRQDVVAGFDESTNEDFVAEVDSLVDDETFVDAFTDVFSKFWLLSDEEFESHLLAA
jgi:hypothetical protein